MAPPPKSRGYYFVIHSQSGETPECPKDTYDMWDGYSLLVGFIYTFLFCFLSSSMLKVSHTIFLQ